jgi:hypothetical protein
MNAEAAKTPYLVLTLPFWDIFFETLPPAFRQPTGNKIIHPKWYLIAVAMTQQQFVD